MNQYTRVCVYEINSSEAAVDFILPLLRAKLSTMEVLIHYMSAASLLTCNESIVSILLQLRCSRIDTIVCPETDIDSLHVSSFAADM